MILKDGVDIERDFTEVANYFKLSGDQGNIEATYLQRSLLSMWNTSKKWIRITKK